MRLLRVTFRYFLRHQRGQTREKYRNVTRKSLISRQRSRLGYDDGGGGNVAVNVVEEAKCPRPRMVHALNTPAQTLVASTNNQNVRAAGCAPDPSINLQ